MNKATLSSAWREGRREGGREGGSNQARNEGMIWGGGGVVWGGWGWEGRLEAKHGGGRHGGLLCVCGGLCPACFD